MGIDSGMEPRVGPRVVIVTTAARQEDSSYIRDLLGPGDRLIAADGGTDAVFDLGLKPDLVVGDFDSIDPETLKQARATCPVRTFPIRKDKTDTHLAIEVAAELDPAEIVVAGGFGDRLDHSLGLVLLVAGLPATPRVRLAGARQEAWILHGDPHTGTDAGAGRAVISGQVGDTVSLLPLTPRVVGVSTEGLGYPLAGAVLHWGQTLGVSNEMLGELAAVTVEEGVLLVIRLRGVW